MWGLVSIVLISIFLSVSIQMREQWNSSSLNDCIMSNCSQIFLPFRNSGVSTDWPGTWGISRNVTTRYLEREHIVLISARGKNWSYTVKLLLQSTGRGCSWGWEPAQRVQAVSSPSTRREGRQRLFFFVSCSSKLFSFLLHALLANFVYRMIFACTVKSSFSSF